MLGNPWYFHLMSLDSSDDAIKLGFILNCEGACCIDTNAIDKDTQKYSNAIIEVFVKNNKVELIIDKRNPFKIAMYYDIDTAYQKLLD